MNMIRRLNFSIQKSNVEPYPKQHSKTNSKFDQKHKISTSFSNSFKHDLIQNPPNDYTVEVRIVLRWPGSDRKST